MKNSTIKAALKKFNKSSQGIKYYMTTGGAKIAASHMRKRDDTKVTTFVSNFNYRGVTVSCTALNVRKQAVLS